MDPRQTIKHRVQNRQDFIVRWLQDFYNQPGNLEEILKILTGESKVSLRLIDWFVTNYSKKLNIFYILDKQQFMVHFHYKRELKAYSKRLFDPFCRRERISFQVRGHAPIKETTVGQLNFFRWAIEKGVIKYIVEHAAEIEDDMNTSYKEHYKTDPESTSSTGRRKRKEMSHSALKTVNHHDLPVMVEFN
jgi:hypothetical protein